MVDMVLKELKVMLVDLEILVLRVFVEEVVVMGWMVILDKLEPLEIPVCLD